MMLAPPGDILLAQEPPEQCVVLAEVVVLMLEPTAEHREVLVLVALADHDLQASTGELVDGGVVLGDAHRVEQAEHGHPGRQQNPVGGRGDRTEQHRRRRRQELPGMTLTDSIRVDPELLGEYRVLDDARQTRVRGEEFTGDRMGCVRNDVENLKAHVATLTAGYRASGSLAITLNPAVRICAEREDYGERRSLVYVSAKELSMSDLPKITDQEMRTIIQYSQPYSVVVLRAGPKFGTPEAKDLIWEHSRRNFSLRAKGDLAVILGVTEDDSDIRGFGIFDKDVETTAKIMNDDPGVQAGVFEFDVHPVRGFPGDALAPKPD